METLVNEITSRFIDMERTSYIFLNHKAQKLHHTYCSSQKMAVMIVLGMFIMTFFSERLHKELTESIILVGFSYGIVAIAIMNYYNYPRFRMTSVFTKYPRRSSFLILYPSIVVGAVSGALFYNSRYALMLIINAVFILVLTIVSADAAYRLGRYKKYNLYDFTIEEDGEEKTAYCKFAISSKGCVCYRTGSMCEFRDLDKIICRYRGKQITRSNYRQYLRR